MFLGRHEDHQHLKLACLRWPLGLLPHSYMQGQSGMWLHWLKRNAQRRRPTNTFSGRNPDSNVTSCSVGQGHCAFFSGLVWFPGEAKLQWVDVQWLAYPKRHKGYLQEETKAMLSCGSKNLYRYFE